MSNNNEHRVTITGRMRLEDDEEEGPKRAGRPNSWWAQHKNDVDDATGRAATFDSAVRGVAGGPHGGSASVRPEDTTGSLTYCWCGLPFDHDWPGKDRGRKHPREERTVSSAGATQQQHIDRRQLRAYNDDLVDVIVEAVNGYHARYRMQKNGIVLFPPDGTSGITVNARTSANQVKSARLWFLRHCVGVGEDGKPANPLVADAEVLHEDYVKRSERVQQETTEVSSLSEPEEVPVSQAAPNEEPWVSYVGSDGEENEFFETNGTIIRCKVCKDTPDHYETESPRGIGGHIRIRHRDNSTLYSEEARARSVESRRYNRLVRQVEDAVKTLGNAIGVEASSEQVEQLKAENAALLKRAEEAEARLALMREALGA